MRKTYRPDSASGLAAYGRSDSASGLAAYGRSDSASGLAAYGRPDSASGLAAYGRSDSGSGLAAYGRSDSGSGLAAYGRSDSGSGLAAYGRPDSGSGLAAYGRPDSGSELAAYGRPQNVSGLAADGRPQNVSGLAALRHQSAAALAFVALAVLLAGGCTRPVAPEAPLPKASASRAVIVQIDGLSPTLLDLYLRSPASRAPGRALARFLVPAEVGGAVLTFATGQAHDAVLPLPALPDPGSAALLGGRAPGALGARDPGDGLPRGTPSLLSVLERTVGIGFVGTPALESNDAARVDAALAAIAALGTEGPQLVAVRLSGLAESLVAGGFTGAPEALGRLDAQLDRLLVPPLTPEDTVLVVTSGFAAAPAGRVASTSAGQSPGAVIAPAELARVVGVSAEDVVPTGGMVRLARLAPEKAAALAAHPATRALLRRTGDALEVWDTDLDRPRPMLEEEWDPAGEPRATARLLAWLRPGEWVALARREGGHEFRRVGEDPSAVAYGGLGAAESVVPVALGGAVSPGDGRPLTVSLEAVAPAVLSLLGRDPALLGSPMSVVDEGRRLADGARRAKKARVVHEGRVVVWTGVADGLRERLKTDAPVHWRTLAEGPANAEALAAAVRDALAVVQGTPAQVVTDTSPWVAWGGPATVTLSLDGLPAEQAASRVRAAARLNAGLRALRAGNPATAARLLREATELPPEVAPWHAAFLYWAERAVARESGATPPPVVPRPVFSGATAGPDAAWLEGVANAFELLTPSTLDAEPERLKRASGLPSVGASEPGRARLAMGLALLFGASNADDCEPRDAAAERVALTRAAESLEVAGEAGLAAYTWRRLALLAGRDADLRAVALTRLALALGAPSAGWARLELAREAIIAFDAGALAGGGSGPEAAGRGASSTGGRPAACGAIGMPPGACAPSTPAALTALSRLYLLKLQADIVADREPGHEQRNLERAAGLLGGAGAREPALQALTVALAIDGRPDLQGRLVAALLSSGLDVTSLLSGRAGNLLAALERLLEVVRQALPAEEPSTPESMLISAVAEAIAFPAAWLSGRPPVPPQAADELLNGLDLVALRNAALAATPADAPTPLRAWGPFIHLVLKAERGLYAALSQGLPAAAPFLAESIALTGRLARGEAARAGVEAQLGPRIDALTTAALAAAQWLAGQGTEVAFRQSLAGLDLSPPPAGAGVAGRAVTLLALVARDAAWLMDVDRRGAAADASVVAGGLDATRELIAEAERPDAAGVLPSRMWRYATLFLHAGQIAVQDAPKWLSDRSLARVLQRVAGSRTALDDIRRRLNAELPETALVAALRADDLGAFLHDQIAFLLENLEDIGRSLDAPPGASPRSNPVVERWVARLRTRLDALAASGATPRTPGRRVEALARYWLLVALGSTADAATLPAIRAAEDAGAAAVAGTSLAPQAWLFALESWSAAMVAGQPAAGLEALDRAAKLCPGRAWNLDLARSWAQSTSDAGRPLLDAYVAESRRRGEGGLTARLRIEGARGNDLYQVELGQSITGMLLGKRSGTFQLGAGARTQTGEHVSLEWGVVAENTPREAAVRAWLLLAQNALLAGDDAALDTALGRLLQAYGGADPAIFGSAPPEALDALPPLTPATPAVRDPLALAWVLTLAEARGHLALTGRLWERFLAEQGQRGWEKVIEGDDFATARLPGCPEPTGAAAASAELLACHAPRALELRLADPAATRALASLVSRTVARVALGNGAGPTASGDAPAEHQALAAAVRAVPRVVPGWSLTLHTARFPASRKAVARKPKLPPSEPPPPRVELEQAAQAEATPSRDLLARLHGAGAVCGAALRAAVTGAAPPDLAAAAGVCGAGGLYLTLLVEGRHGTPAEIVAQAGAALVGVRRLSGGQLGAWEHSLVQRIGETLLVNNEEIRAATAADAAKLVPAARAAGAPALALTLRAFSLAWALARNAPATDTPDDLLREAREAGLGGLPAVRLAKRLRFGGPADTAPAVAEFLAGPLPQNP